MAIGVIGLGFLFYESLEDSTNQRVKNWEESKQSCLAVEPKYYCDSILGVDFQHSPESF